MSLTSYYTIGADPELFLFNDKEEPISAIDKIKGSKEAPHPIRSLGKGFSVQVDNCSVEYNIPPVKDTEVMVENHLTMLSYLKDYFEPVNLLPKAVASVEFDRSQLLDPRAWVFGCEPDFNAWTLQINPRPEADNPQLRSAGGHIHIGCHELNNKEKVGLVRILDIILGRALALAEPKNQRAELYGKPGAMRFKPYGLEWRTPSNFWLSSPEVLSNTMNALVMILDAYKNNQLKELATYYDYFEITEMFKNPKKNPTWSLENLFSKSIVSNTEKKVNPKPKKSPYTNMLL